MDSTFVYNTIHALFPGASTWLTGLIVTLLTALIGYIAGELKNMITQPKKDVALIKGTAAITAELLSQQMKDKNKVMDKDSKNLAVLEKYNATLYDNSKPSIDNKVDQAIKKAGGILRVINTSVSVLKQVTTLFKK